MGTQPGNNGTLCVYGGTEMTSQDEQPDHTFEECTCGTCMETIGYDPEIPCPDCPYHSEPRRAND